ncbi:hypothetical protein [Neoroseomonas lacus]|uniref:Uncharacterized protein n=1 Tax=Neoroseomonas lacus TaxID=287609 RepID=A0A917NIC8_9PROT|nr:hypothetical protein [Neoroseomonas lacus]GGJ03043.1 hypothetical protein GCM10011320_07410 [Neoroseomonas lacus]
MLQDLVERLTIPGMPSWVALVLLGAITVSLLAFLAMPFAVFGVKSRLEAIEAELADLRMELRALVLQGPGASVARAPVEVDYVAPPVRGAKRAPEFDTRIAPPVPPPAARPAARSTRAEPRLDWPKADRGA